VAAWPGIAGLVGKAVPCTTPAPVIRSRAFRFSPSISRGDQLGNLDLPITLLGRADEVIE